MNQELLKVVGELSFAVAKAHDNIVLEEKEALQKNLREKFGELGEHAKMRFDLLCEVADPSVVHAYNNAIHELKKNKKNITDTYYVLTLEILETVAKSHHGMSNFQLFIIDRFKHDYKAIAHGL